MSDNDKIEIEKFVIGNTDSNKLIAKEIESLQLKVEELTGDNAKHFTEQIQPWLDQFNDKNNIDINLRALHTAANLFNHFISNVNKHVKTLK